ncbi:symmetrical bis(5'-nucleosyl)-tetraphosphatase [Celerinatantimonas sp. YJH-8]|uniref:symmetrical bis(5'-nucleosyl)-tetraphosphatase n=1 Tax=Celerinatantimonas sp. YJH-8 TaxID=3228714 RepID=UPI0038C6D991
MKHCIIGDVHGCYDELMQLIDMAQVDLSHEQLWFTGDLIGRGKQPLETLRFIQHLGHRAQVVLGNHDLHFLAVANGIAPVKARDHLEALLKAPDREELFEWLWQQPLLAQLDTDTVMVHAGITPQWSQTEAILRAQEISNIFADRQNRHELLAQMYGDTPNRWDETLSGMDRYRFIINSFTRMRCCYADLSLDFQYKEAPEQAPDGLKPWFELRKDRDNIIFGHWAALMGAAPHANIYALDTGCIWGNQLSLLRWETKELCQTSCPAYRRSN